MYWRGVGGDGGQEAGEDRAEEGWEGKHVRCYI